MNYRHPIEVLKQVEQSGDLGCSALNLEVVRTCKANINGVGGKEYFKAAQMQAENEVTFTIRYSESVASLLVAEMYIRFRGDIYDITHVDNYMFGNRTLKLKGVVRESL